MITLPSGFSVLWAFIMRITFPNACYKWLRLISDAERSSCRIAFTVNSCSETLDHKLLTCNWTQLKHPAYIFNSMWFDNHTKLYRDVGLFRSIVQPYETVFNTVGNMHTMYCTHTAFEEQACSIGEYLTKSSSFSWNHYLFLKKVCFSKLLILHALYE